MKIFCFGLVIPLILLVQHGESCFLPSDLSGAWYSSTKGLISFNATSNATTIPSFSTSKFGTLSFSCSVSSESKYIFKSSSFAYYGLNFEVFICLEISERKSASFYIYYLGSVENADADNERLKSALVSSNTIPTVASMCDRVTYATGSENILLKNDGNELNSMIRFPFDFRGKWTYNYTSGGSTSCASDSGVDICGSGEARTMTYNYTACSTIQAYSATGVLKCIYYTSDSSFTYMYVYNTDSTTDESTTYRFTCYVISKVGSIVYATQYPQQCASSQNATSVSSPGALLVFSRTESCPYDTSSSVISMASAAGLAVGLLLLIIIIVCGVLLWYYYKKRKQREVDKLPLQKAQPANKRLVNGDLYRDGRVTGSKTPRAMNGDVKVNVEDELGVRRENSIHISMTSRGGSGLGGLDGDRRQGVAPVEEPEVNYISDDVIIESENEATLASTFLPISTDEKNELHFTDEEIKAIEKKSFQKEEKDSGFDMDEIDDELGLPRLSRAFTPVIQPEEATLPTIAYKKINDTETESDDERRADGIKKVKLKKHGKKKKRVRSAKENVKGVRVKSGSKTRSSSVRETPFLDRLKKQETETAEREHREKIERETKEIENEVIKARLAKNAKAARAAPSDKYVVDRKGSEGLQRPDKGSSTASASGERRRFGDPPAESARKNRKRTPRLRHPMEIQGDSEEVQDKKESFKKAEEFWKDEKRARSGRRREHPEALTIPSLKEDPFDHRDDKPPGTPSFSQARSGKSAVGMRLERENSAFIAPVKDPASDENLWQRASNLWHHSNNHKPIWNNLALHH